MSIKGNLATIPAEWNATWVISRYPNATAAKYTLSIVESDSGKVLIEHVLGLAELVASDYNVEAMSQKLIDAYQKKTDLESFIDKINDNPFELPALFTYSVGPEGITVRSNDPGFMRLATNDDELQQAISEAQTIRRIYDLLNEDLED